MEAYISSFTYCDSIRTEVTPEGTSNEIVTPLQQLEPIAIPGNYSFAISCSITGFDVDKVNTVQILFQDFNKQILYDSGVVEFQVPVNQQQKKGMTSMQFNIDFRNLVFRNEGLYSTEIIFNGKSLGEQKIQVLRGDVNVGNK